MMYNQKFVVIIKVNGRVLREKGDTVYVPFGAEYEITLKNLNSVKAVVNVEVDGSDTMDGNQVIVPADGSVTIEGFMEGRKVKNKFKFIEKTAQISAFRGDKVSDGLVRVTYQFEYVWPHQIYYTNPNSVVYGSSFPEPTCKSGSFDAFCTSESFSSSSKIKNKSNTPKNSLNIGAIVDCCAFNAPENESGITVKGSQSDQRFVVGSVGMLDAQKHIIILQLKGRLKKKKVYEAVTVRTKVQCEICGKKNKSRNRFCINCGTSLV